MFKNERDKEFQLRVFLRTYQDAVTCVGQIAARKYSQKLYTDYVKMLTSAIKRNQILFNEEGQIIASTNLPAVQIYENLRFAKALFRRFEMDKLSSRSQFQRKLRKGIIELEEEIQKKAQELEDKIKKLEP